MTGIEVNIVEFVDDYQPGIVRCEFVDAYGKTWNIIEKAPIVSSEYLDSKSIYLQTGFIAAEVKEIFLDNDNNELAIIDTNVPWGVWAENDEFMFTVHKKQLIDIERT